MILYSKESERLGLAQRFDIPHLEFFSANITLRSRDAVSIAVDGSIEAHIRFGEVLDIEKIKSSFETLILNNYGKSSTGIAAILAKVNYQFLFRLGLSLSLDDETDYDDEVDSNGNIDLGEIASQYLALELFWKKGK